ncbi:aminopeptidase P family protein [Candidatus Woesearchaeota archaeon]|nr:aminopeptidase P family protein [Candidatus Woesearchaeota archaeon]
MKLRQLQQILKDKGVDILLLHSLDEQFNANMFYLSGYDSLGILAVYPTEPPRLLVPKMEFGLTKDARVRAEIWPKRRFPDVIADLTKDAKSIGLDFRKATLAFAEDFKKDQLCDLSGDLILLRSTKTEDEIELMQQTQRIADDVFRKTVSHFKRFSSEQAVAAFMDSAMRDRGVKESFSTIVASGPNAAIPHHKPTNKLHKGLCVIDFGVRYRGYCSDTTRTISCGNPIKEQEQVYHVVKAAQESCTSRYKPGTVAADIDAKARSALGMYRSHFIHGLGHGIGIDVHETPGIRASEKTVLKNAMVISNEPGVYIPDKMGVRIEDCIVVGKTPRILSKLSRDLVVV